MTVRTNEGREIFTPLEHYIIWHSSWFFIPNRCTFCPDGLAELADICFGDAWMPEFKDRSIGWSVLVSRSELGESVLRGLALNGSGNVEKTSAEQVVRSQLGVLYSKKKVIRARIRLFHRNARNPLYSLPPSPLDYLSATYQQVRDSLLTSRPYLRRVFKHIPRSIVRLHELPLALTRRIQMRKIMKQRVSQ
jgi:hypothetical protein